MRVNSVVSQARRVIRDPRLQWARDFQLLLELFVTVNLAFLALDIYIAHSVNQFRHVAEYIPFYYSIAAPLALASVITLRWVWHFHTPWRDVGYLVGWLAVLIGLGGVLFHLESRFFVDRTLKSLTYAAPFAAPLAYSGLGFLLLVNRMVDSRSAEWARWIIFMALGGFFGNFVLTLTDHATNAFFLKTEWVPVISSAFATGFLVVPLMLAVTRRFLDACVVVMLVQAFVGIIGFWLHLEANLIGPGQNLFDRLVNGAPPIAPLLFPNLVGLAFIGLWALTPHLPDPSPAKSWLGIAYTWTHFGEETGAPSPSRNSAGVARKF